MQRNGAALQTTEQTGGPQTVRCAIYTRKSTTAGLEQDFNSLDAQRDACLYFIRSQAHARWVHTATFEDGGYSGANTERPGFQKLMEAISDRQVDVVIVYKVDRLSRSLSDFSQIMQVFQGHQVAFVSVTQNFSTADAIGRLTLNMLMSFAEFEREMIAERTRDKIASTRRRGLWTGGSVPFGYRNDGGKLVPVPEEVAIVREVFALYLEHYSALAIAHHLNARAAPSRARGRKTAPSAGAWSKVTVLRLLQNPIYIGKIPHHGEVFAGEHAAIVDEAIFAQVQQLLGHTQATRIRHPEDTYLLRGLIVCGCCMARFTPATGKRLGNKAYRYYRCTSRDHHGARACPSKPLSAQALEDFVIEQIRALLCQEPMRRDLTAATRLRLAEQAQALRQECAALPPRIASRAAHLQALSAQPQSPALAAEVEQVAAALAQMRDQLDDSTRRLQAIQRTEVDLDWVSETLRSFDDCWAALSSANRQRLLRGLIAEIVVLEPQGQLDIQLLPWVTQEKQGGANHPEGAVA